MAGREVIEDDDVVPGRNQGLDRDRPDVARTTRDENAHAESLA